MTARTFLQLIANESTFPVTTIMEESELEPQIESMAKAATSSVQVEAPTAPEMTSSKSNQLVSRFMKRKAQLATVPLEPLPFCSLKLLPVLIVVQVSILALFCINCTAFFLSLKTVSAQEDRISEHEANYTKVEVASLEAPTPFPPDSKIPNIIQELATIRREKSKYLSLVVITLVSFPFHLFGAVAATKRSFTLTLTYAIITFILLCLQLKPNLSIDGSHYLILWFVQFSLFITVVLFCLRLYWEKIRKIELL